MSRTASATPPPPYFPQRTATPTMRHAAPPGNTAVHYPRSVSASSIVTPEKGKRRIKHLPPALGGLKGRTAGAASKVGVSGSSKSGTTAAQPGSAASGAGAVEPAVVVTPETDLGVEAYRHVLDDGDVQMNLGDQRGSGIKGQGLPIMDEFWADARPLAANRSDWYDARHRRSPASPPSNVHIPMTESDALYIASADVDMPLAEFTGPDIYADEDDYMMPDGRILSRVKRPMEVVAPFGTSNDRDAPLPPSAVPAPPACAAAAGRSWVPHFGFGKVAKVVSSGINHGSLGWSSLTSTLGPGSDQSSGGSDKRKKDAPIRPSPGKQPSLAPLRIPDFVQPTPVPILDVRAYADETTFLPRARPLELPEGLVEGLDEDDVRRKKREWAEAQHQRLTECARLCSQWPQSGYNMSKWGPNGAKHFYEPQSYGNPEHVNTVMARQAALEQRMSAERRLYFPSYSYRYSSSADSAESVDNSALPSPATSMATSGIGGDAAHTEAEIRVAMSSPLLIAAAPAPAPARASQSQVSLLLPAAPKQSLEQKRSLTELNALASGMMLSKRDVKTDDPAADVDMDLTMGEEVEVETDTTSLAPSLANSDMLDPPVSASALTPSSLSVPPAKATTRPTRAQSCGSKRPLPPASASAGADEEKRRRVDADEAMVIQEAVSSGVIQPTSPVVAMSPKSAPRLCASTPDLGAVSKADCSRIGPDPVIGGDDKKGSTTPEPITNGAMFGHIVKTSDTHPIIISSFFPADLLPVLAEHLSATQTFGSPVRVPVQLGSGIDVPALLLSHSGQTQTQTQTPPITTVPSPSSASFSLSLSLSEASSTARAKPRLGNLFLSSCPGKRLRMEGPVKGRGPVCRDVKVDLGRIKAEGVGCLVCCLDDPELALLGTPWETYRDVANDLGLDIIRVPMPDGFTPVSLALFDSQITLIASKYTLKGVNVLVHCRGGVGRAGVTACAWAIKMGYVQPHPSLALVEEAAKRKAAITPTPLSKSSTGAATSISEKRPMFPFFSSSSSSSASSKTALVSSATATAAAAAVTPETHLNLAAVELPAELEHQIVMSIVERVIAMIRSRRGLKAIESFEQVQFLACYVRWLRAGSRGAE